MTAGLNAWYANRVKDKLNCKDVEVVELQIGAIKVLFEMWLMNAIAVLKKEMIIKGVKKAIKITFL